MKKRDKNVANELFFINLVLNRAVVSRDMSRSRDTIFQSLGLEGLKPRSRLGLGTSKSRKMGKSRPYFQSKRKNPQ